MSADVDIEIPDAMRFLLTEDARYKVVCGGRGKGASWSFARALLVRGAQRPTRWLCCREIQRSIADSVHQLFADQISMLNLGGVYRVMADEIRGPHGTKFGYAGLRHNVQELRSWEGADGAWVTEATNVSKTSWNILTPTIRKNGSEIWVDFNPELETDETYQRLVVHPPEGAIVKLLSWRDNPFFNDILRKDKADLEQRDPEEALTVWEGKTRQSLKEAIYADEIISATRDGRITKVPWDGVSPVDTYWDLGHSDLTAIWFVQKAGFEWHVIDYLQESLKKIGWYLEQLQSRKYIYGTHYLPHDAANETLGADAIEKQVERTYPKRVVVVPRVNEKKQTHNAVKTVFPHCWFDEERCADGLQGLRHYRFKRDPKSGALTHDPLHDWAMDVADSFGTFALAKNMGRKSRAAVRDVRPSFVQASKGGGPSTQWMGS